MEVKEIESMPAPRLTVVPAVLLLAKRTESFFTLVVIVLRVTALEGNAIASLGDRIASDHGGTRYVALEQQAILAISIGTCGDIRAQTIHINLEDQILIRRFTGKN